MNRAGYIALVALAYVVMFALLLYVAGPPATGPIETALVVTALSATLSWLLTARGIAIAPARWPVYRLPTMLHSAVFAIVAGVTAKVMLGG